MGLKCVECDLNLLIVSAAKIWMLRCVPPVVSLEELFATKWWENFYASEVLCILSTIPLEHCLAQILSLHEEANQEQGGGFLEFEVSKLMCIVETQKCTRCILWRLAQILLSYVCLVNCSWSLSNKSKPRVPSSKRLCANFIALPHRRLRLSPWPMGIMGTSQQTVHFFDREAMRLNG